jgi:hypothetical protein
LNEYNYLFSKVDWHSVDRHQRDQLRNEVASLDGDRLLNTSIDDLCKYFENKYCVNVPTLCRDDIVADQRETQIDVSRDQMRYISDRSKPFRVPGTMVEVAVPFEGDDAAFTIQPTTWSSSPPQGDLRNGVLILRIQGTSLDAVSVRTQIDRTLGEIESHLTTLRGNAAGLNNQLATVAREAIEQRRKKLLADRNLVSELGFKMKTRDNDSKTYAAPEVRRKLAPTLPLASKAPYKPEPTLTSADYDHILGVIQNMAHVMERSPSAFTSMDEESLRSHFLVQLNGHFEGQATGETFNYQGKTDILIRSEGKNIFIAECKFWGGAKKLAETIDQLLSYSSWRDTKVAVIVFNRNKDFSNVVRTIDRTVSEHTGFKRKVQQVSETAFQYVFAHRDDPNRELLVTVLAFDVPT